MRITHNYPAAACVGLAAILTLACRDSTAPERAEPAIGAISIKVSTLGVDIDPDGYTAIVDGGPGRAVAVNDTVTFSALTIGTHVVWLNGLAPNCSVTNTSVRSVNVFTEKAVPRVNFSVFCAAMDGSGNGYWDY